MAKARLIASIDEELENESCDSYVPVELSQETLDEVEVVRPGHGIARHVETKHLDIYGFFLPPHSENNFRFRC